MVFVANLLKSSAILMMTLALFSGVCVVGCSEGASDATSDVVEEAGDVAEEADDAVEEAGDVAEEAGDAAEETADE